MIIVDKSSAAKQAAGVPGAGNRAVASTLAGTAPDHAPDEAARAAVELGCRQLLQTHANARDIDPVAEHFPCVSVRDLVRGSSVALARQ